MDGPKLDRSCSGNLVYIVYKSMLVMVSTLPSIWASQLGVATTARLVRCSKTKTKEKYKQLRPKDKTVTYAATRQRDRHMVCGD